MNYKFEKMTTSHSKEVIDIFNYYIENSFAAYFDNKLPYEFFTKFIEMTKNFPAYIIKSEDTGKVVGFSFLKAYSPLPAFKETAEITYFIEKDSVRSGLGKAALTLLEQDAKNIGIKYLLASISSKNTQSLKFHEKNGFNQCGRFYNIGQKK
ncbi:GCN5-related N-acetyltransferase [Clostridium carboxidivorans P7]|uniref:GCN5-related N-acetyltransferase n=1 Tax=Clostridium carboxidivorans P7 TaxID=536227 RepID=C6PSS0_9CLOT|nr:GNAT family N-acetyltransferase [Clostridium carboxidivorans]EET87749.1 GCN5-related N-acetyltransferase [Clostridium carboxidivorans P7]